MSVFYDEINIKTKGEVDIIDITSDIQNVIDKSKIINGLVCVFVPGSTGTITTIEYEPGLKKDFPRALQKIAPKGEYYNHHETWHDDNGHSPNIDILRIKSSYITRTYVYYILT